MNRQKINKLFFNKWPFKISCEIVGASKVKYAGPERIRMWVNADSDNFFFEDGNRSWSMIAGRRRKTIDKFELLKFANAVEPFMLLPKDQVQIRAEGSHFNIFCKDTAIKTRIESDLYPWIREVHGPETDEELEFMLTNNKKVICNHLPYDKYKFKVVLKDWVKEESKKEALYNFLLKQPEESVHISKETAKWLQCTSSYKQDPFFYIADEKQLVFIRLMFSDIKTVYEYVERDGINTSLQ